MFDITKACLAGQLAVASKLQRGVTSKLERLQVVLEIAFNSELDHDGNQDLMTSIKESWHHSCASSLFPVFSSVEGVASANSPLWLAALVN